MTSKEKLKEKLADFLDCAVDEIILTWKGRVGLYGMLKSLDIGENDEVIIPAYTCIVVPNAIIYLGAIPIYVDIDPKTYNIDPKKIEKKITKRTKVVIAQNTYGLSSDIDAIKIIADKHGLKILEDCTHGFGGKYKGILNGKHVDSAFYSSQWNKMFSTGVGGITITKDENLKKKMVQFEKQLTPPSFFDSLILKAQLVVKDLIGYSSIYWTALKLYRYLTSNNIILGSSSGDELTSVTMPDGYLKGYSEVQAKKSLKELDRIQGNILHRKQVAHYYDTILATLGITPPFVPHYSQHTYTKYPLLVKNREKIFNAAKVSNLPIHDWFTSPLHPVNDNLELWHFNETAYPIATTIAKHVINLPTDFSVSKSMSAKIGDFLLEHREQLINVDQVIE